MSDYLPTLIVPGLNGSGAGHWQTWWQQQDRNAIRVEQQNNQVADLEVWSQRIRYEIAQESGAVWIVAHSFGCLASLHAAQFCGASIAGLFLVAMADPDKFGVSVPQHLHIPSLVVASCNDPWLSVDKAKRIAASLGSCMVDIGNAGHINVDSGYGAWQQGFDLFRGFRRAVLAERFGEALFS